MFYIFVIGDLERNSRNYLFSSRYKTLFLMISLLRTSFHLKETYSEICRSILVIYKYPLDGERLRKVKEDLHKLHEEKKSKI